LGTPFAQFLKINSELRYTWKLGANQSLATRIAGGVIWAYGNSRIAPYSEQFYVGGANSIRAFTVRSIGPGGYAPDKANRYSFIDQTGDIRFEANAEYRFRMFGDLHGALFLDAGNVWLLRDDPEGEEGEKGTRSRQNGAFKLSKFPKQIALGTGFGLRYDFGFLVIRLDCGIALHAPYETTKKGYYNIEKFSDGLGFHFAVGYPF
ncbi:MAG: BamA/TamA family outer membrane protein, partial [Bacteroides sp.]